MPPVHRRIVRLATLLTAALASTAALGAPPGPADGTTPLRRLVRRFDFEERAQAPWDMPLGFHRIGPDEPASEVARDEGRPLLGAARPGFPLFGWMGFTEDDPKGGRFAFGFELKGGSMAARVPPEVLPVVPGADYLVTASVRTRGLRHARARVAAVFFDQFGHAVPGSLVESEPLQTDGAWVDVSLELRGRFPEAAHLVLELQLLQPAQWGADLRLAPGLEDVTGGASFDEVAVWHLPRLSVEPAEGSPILVGTGEHDFVVTARDIASDDLRLRLVVSDLAGRAVLERDLPPRSGPAPRRVTVPLPRCGWYRATIEARGPKGILATAGRDVIVAPPRRRHESEPKVQFGLNLEREPLVRLPRAAATMDALDLRSAVLPAWDPNVTLDAVETRVADLRSVLDALLRERRTIALALTTVPRVLAEAETIDPRDVPALLERPESVWMPYLGSLLVNFGQRVQDWQIGATDVPGSFSTSATTSGGAAGRAALARLVPGPRILTPARALGAPPSNPAASHARISYRVSPGSIVTALDATTTEGATTGVALPRFVSIEPPPRGRFTAADRVVDLALRGLHAWRAGVERPLLAEPWTTPPASEDPVDLDPCLAAWAGLARVLTGRQFEGEIELAPGIEAWLVDGPAGAAIVAWNDAAPDDASILARLADGPVEACDLFGNRRVVAPAEDGTHEVAVPRLPIVIEGIDGMSARLRRSFTLEPGFLPAVAREHAMTATLTNPWPVTLTGAIELRGPAGWSFVPSRHAFSIGPGETASFNVAASFGRAEPAGRRTIEATIVYQTDRPGRIRHEASVEVGLRHLATLPGWRVVRNERGEAVDVVLTQHITNTGPEPLDLEAFVLAPGYPRDTSPIARLAPGATVVRSFYLADGVRRLAGRRLLLGVADRFGGGRLNAPLEFPEIDPATATVVSETTTAPASDH